MDGKVLHDLHELTPEDVGLENGFFEDVQNRALEGAQATDRYIRANPYQALGIVLGLGLVAGFLLKRR